MYHTSNSTVSVAQLFSNESNYNAIWLTVHSDTKEQAKTIFNELDSILLSNPQEQHQPHYDDWKCRI